MTHPRPLPTSITSQLNHTDAQYWRMLSGAKKREYVAPYVDNQIDFWTMLQSIRDRRPIKPDQTQPQRSTS